jgi:hypothetical protein
MINKKNIFVIFLEMLDADELRTVKSGLLTLASSAPWKENKWGVIYVHDFDRQDYTFFLYMLFFFHMLFAYNISLTDFDKTTWNKKKTYHYNKSILRKSRMIQTMLLLLLLHVFFSNVACSISYFPWLLLFLWILYRSDILSFFSFEQSIFSNWLTLQWRT